MFGRNLKNVRTVYLRGNGIARMQYGVSCTLYFGEGTSDEKRMRVYVTYEKDIYFCKKKHNYNARDNLGMH